MTEPTQITLLIVLHRYRLNLTKTEIKKTWNLLAPEKRQNSWHKHILHHKNIRLSDDTTHRCCSYIKIFVRHN